MITALAWSPTRAELAVAGYSGLVQLWSVAGTPRLMRSFVGLQRLVLVGLPEAIQAVAFSPDGRLLAASANNEAQTSPGEFNSFDNRLALLAIWRASTGKLVAPPRDLGTFSAQNSASDVLAFSRNGKLLAVTLLDGSDLVLDASTGQTRQTLRALGADPSISLAFAPDGTLATGTSRGIVQLWNPTTGNPIAHPLVVASTPVTSIAFDPSGQRFATTGGQDGTVKLWSTSTLQQEGTTPNTEQGATSTAAFEPDGRSLLVINDHGDGFTWPTSLAAWEQHACAVAGRNLTREEWARFLTGRAYTKVCP